MAGVKPRNPNTSLTPETILGLPQLLSVTQKWFSTSMQSSTTCHSFVTDPQAHNTSKMKTRYYLLEQLKTCHFLIRYRMYWLLALAEQGEYSPL